MMNHHNVEVSPDIKNVLVFSFGVKTLRGLKTAFPNASGTRRVVGL